jgi:NO-binding membrane sensor protein with MHYT domain
MSIAVGASNGAAVAHLANHHSYLHASYNLYFVALSYGLAALGSFGALASATRIREHRGLKRLAWSATTALALGGGGIWSMHLVGVVAYHVDSAVSFDLRVTMLSLLIAVAVAGIGIWLVAADPFNTGRLVGGGVFAGLGIAAMHYTGMAAMRTAGTIGYDPTLVLLSIVIAAVATTAAFWIAFHVGGGTRRVLGASLVMAAAVCGMHYTALAATQVTPDPIISVPIGSDPLALGLLTAFGSTIVLMFIIVAALGGVTDPEFSVRRIGPKAGAARVDGTRDGTIRDGTIRDGTIRDGTIRDGARVPEVPTVDPEGGYGEPDILSSNRNERTMPLRVRRTPRASVGAGRGELAG